MNRYPGLLIAAGLGLLLAACASDKDEDAHGEPTGAYGDRPAAGQYDHEDPWLEPIPGEPYECIPAYPDVRTAAHRGHTQYAPENTLPAYGHAFEIGVTAVEMDIRDTADGRYVMIHDDTVDRTTNGTGYVNEMTLEEIRELEVDDWRYGGRFPGLRVPTFEEAIELARVFNGEIYLDTKTDMVEEAAQIVLDKGMEDLVFFYSSNWGKLARIRAVDPRLRIQPHTYNIEDTLELIELFEPDPELFEIDSGALSPEHVDLIHEHGSLAHFDLLGTRDILFLIGLEQAWLEPLEAGVDQVQTDYPVELIEYLGSLCE